MILGKKGLVCLIMTIFLFVLSYKLRIYNYHSIPVKGQSVDEYSYSWVGLSLIRLGLPIGISGLPGYKNFDYRYINVDNIFYNGEATDGSPLPLNYPWFDHPPGLGLITGGYAYMKGARVFEDMTTSLIRKPMIYIGTLSTILLFFNVCLRYGIKKGFLSGLVYAISPLAVVSSRMVQAENVLILICLMALLCYQLYGKTKHLYWWWLSSIVAGSALFFKLSGVYIIFTIFLLFISDKNNLSEKIKGTVVLAVCSFCFLSVFMIYGSMYSWDQFVNIFLSNSVRVYGIGFNVFLDLIRNSKITMGKFLTDPYYLMAWIIFLINLKNFKQNKIFLIPMVCYMAVYILMGSYSYGWYTFPFIPFLYGGLGIYLGSKVDMSKIFIDIAIFAFWMEKLFAGNINMISVWRYLVPSILIWLILVEIYPKIQGFKQYFFWILFILNLVLSLNYLGKIDTDFWYTISCHSVIASIG